jgi:hypothetical protein
VSLLIVLGHLRRRFAHFNLRADFLDLRCLLFHHCGESSIPDFHSAMVASCFAALHFNWAIIASCLHFAMLFKELIEQDRVNPFVADCVNFRFAIAGDEIGQRS